MHFALALICFIMLLAVPGKAADSSPSGESAAKGSTPPATSTPPADDNKPGDKDKVDAASALPSGYAASILHKVDARVKESFWNKEGLPDWTKEKERMQEEITGATTYAQLSDSINKLLESLKSSHCKFAFTKRSFYAQLHDQEKNEARPKSNDKSKQVAWVGIHTGPSSKITYCHPDGPAYKAGLRRGDEMVSVNGKPWANGVFFGYEGKAVPVVIRRDGVEKTIIVIPVLVDLEQFDGKSIRSSARIIRQQQGAIGYVLVRGFYSDTTARAFHDVIAGKLHDTDALIVDVRDGYGGSVNVMFKCLNVLYTMADKPYPPVKVYMGPATMMYHRNGEMSLLAPVGSRGLGRYYPKKADEAAYGKPLVVLIDKNSASAMEIFAAILKKTGRATLVGERTSGAVLGAQFFNIGKDAMLSLPTSAIEVGRDWLEGVGVAPDREIANPADAKEDMALSEAVGLLCDKLTQAQEKPAESH